MINTIIRKMQTHQEWSLISDRFSFTKSSSIPLVAKWTKPTESCYLSAAKSCGSLDAETWMISTGRFLGTNDPWEVDNSSAVKGKLWPYQLLWGLIRGPLAGSSKDAFFPGSFGMWQSLCNLVQAQPTSTSRELCAWKAVLTELRRNKKGKKRRHI